MIFRGALCERAGGDGHMLKMLAISGVGVRRGGVEGARVFGVFGRLFGGYSLVSGEFGVWFFGV